MSIDWQSVLEALERGEAPDPSIAGRIRYLIDKNNLPKDPELARYVINKRREIIHWLTKPPQGKRPKCPDVLICRKYVDDYVYELLKQRDAGLALDKKYAKEKVARKHKVSVRRVEVLIAVFRSVTSEIFLEPEYSDFL